MDLSFLAAESDKFKQCCGTVTIFYVKKSKLLKKISIEPLNESTLIWLPLDLDPHTEHYVLYTRVHDGPGQSWTSEGVLLPRLLHDVATGDCDAGGGHGVPGHGGRPTNLARAGRHPAGGAYSQQRQLLAAPVLRVHRPLSGITTVHSLVHK